MASSLIITQVEKLQNRINTTVGSFDGTPGVYVSLNKPQKNIEGILKKNKIDSNKLFFIDCVVNEKARDDVLHISPDELYLLSSAINSFIKQIDGEKFLIIDGLSTLLIYNNDNNVAKFVKEVTEYASRQDVSVMAFSPKTKGEELLNKIFNFFDEVKKWIK